MKQKNINLLDVVKRLANKTPLTKEQETINRSSVDRMKERGISTVGAFNFELRSSIMADPDLAGSFTPNLYSKNSTGRELLDRVIFYRDLSSNAKIPCIDFNAVQWVGDGMASPSGHELKGLSVKPHRLSTNVTISNSILNEVGDFEEKVKQQLVNAIYAKLIGSMFSTAEGNDIQPKGLFGGIEVCTLTDYDSLLEMQFKGDAKGTDNVWVVSPKAKQRINSLAGYPLISDNRMLNSDCFCVNQTKDDVVGYLPLNLVAVADWSAAGITVDAVTKAKDGEIIIYIDAYFDFGNLNDDYVQVGRFAEVEKTGD